MEGLFSTGSRKRETAGVKHMPMNFTTELNLRFILLTHIYSVPFTHCGLPSGSAVKNLPASARDPSLIPGSERSPGEGNGNPLQCSCLRNPMDKGAWWAKWNITQKRIRQEERLQKWVKAGKRSQHMDDWCSCRKYTSIKFMECI